MTNHVMAAHSIESACILLRDALNHLDEADIERLSRLKHLITQLSHEAAELRSQTRLIFDSRQPATSGTESGP
jgi:hypothetical protein